MVRIVSPVVWVLILSFAISGRAQNASTEIPFEKCDRLLTVKVGVDGKEMRFLVDSGATTMLNLKSFAGTADGHIKINSWAGTAATSAREVSLPKLNVGSHEIRNLKLPAIDLSPIGSACGGQIDGIFGVGPMEKMGVKIDFENKLLSFKASQDEIRAMYNEMEAAMHPCTLAFE